MSEFPVSVIVIQISPENGKAFRNNFKPGKLVYSKKLGKTAKRDNVINASYRGSKKIKSMVQAIFNALQKQFVEYMTINKIEPKEVANTTTSFASNEHTKSGFSPFAGMMNNFRKELLNYRLKEKKKIMKK